MSSLESPVAIQYYILGTAPGVGLQLRREGRDAFLRLLLRPLLASVEAALPRGLRGMACCARRILLWLPLSHNLAPRVATVPATVPFLFPSLVELGGGHAVAVGWHVAQEGAISGDQSVRAVAVGHTLGCILLLPLLLRLRGLEGVVHGSLSLRLLFSRGTCKPVAGGRMAAPLRRPPSLLWVPP